MSYSDSITLIDGIETGANDEPTNAEVKTQYLNNADTNEFVLANKTLLEGISKTSSLPFTAPTLLNNWVNYNNGYDPAGYCKDASGTVHIRAMVKSGNNDSVIFNLPVGFRPVNTHIIGCLRSSDSVADRVDIYSGGDVRYRGSTSGTSWIAIFYSFKAEL